jgi:hypothetical protein
MHIISRFGTYSPKLNAILLQEVHILKWYLLFGVIALIDEAEDVFIIIGILFGFFDPELFQVLEGFRVVNITDQNDGISPFIIGLGNTPESLLSCCIPYLKFDILLIDVQRPSPYDKKTT